MLIITKEYTDSISKDRMMNVDSIAIYDTLNGTDIYPLTSYQMVFQAQGRYNQFASVIGSTFSPKVKNIISHTHKGDRIIIAAIHFRDAKDANVRLPHAVNIYLK